MDVCMLVMIVVLMLCGNNLLEIIDKAWNAYDFMCSQTA